LWIIITFEKAGLNIFNMKMLVPSNIVVNKHYPDVDEYYSKMGK